MIVLTRFEHESLRVGEAGFEPHHFQALLRWQQSQPEGRFFHIGHQRIGFRQYVGVVRVGGLCIEILPKTAHNQPEHWQRALLEMAETAEVLPMDLPLEAGLLEAGLHRVFGFYLKRLALEINRLLDAGLERRYRRVEERLPFLRGALHLPKQLAQAQRGELNEGFFVRHQRFDTQYLAHQLLAAGLERALSLVEGLSPDAQNGLRRAAARFPSEIGLPPKRIEESDFQQVLARYAPESGYAVALRLVRWLLLRGGSSLQAGDLPVQALLFDMNRLFERYVQRLLVETKPLGAHIWAQARRRFWGKLYLQPDLLLEFADRRWVLDCKWKTPPFGQPDETDLRQLFAYQQLFEAKRGALLYPLVQPLPDEAHRYALEQSNFWAEARFLRVLHPDGRLNRDLGAEIWARVLAD